MDKIRQFLKKHYDNYEIKEAFFGKIMCCAFLPFKYQVLEEEADKEIRYPIAELEKLYENIDIRNKDYKSSFIIKALNKNNNIFNVAEICESKLPISSIDINGVIFQDKIFTFEVKIPTRAQKFHNIFGGKLIEDFKVVSNGSFFFPYVKIDDFEHEDLSLISLSHFAQELREIIYNQINKESDFGIMGFGPNPMHPDIFIISIDTEGSTKTAVNYFNLRNNLLIVFENSAVKDPILVVFDLLTLGSLSFFYRGNLSKSYLISLYSEISNYFEDLSNIINGLFNAKWYQLFKYPKLSKMGRKIISNIYKQIITYENKVIGYNENRLFFLNNLDEISILSPIKKYFSDITSGNFQNIKSFMPALAFFESQLNVAGNIKGLIVGSLITALGALIGAAITIITK